MIFTLILAFGVQEKSYETFWRFSNLKSESLQSYDLVHMKKKIIKKKQFENQGENLCGVTILLQAFVEEHEECLSRKIQPPDGGSR